MRQLACYTERTLWNPEQRQLWQQLMESLTPRNHLALVSCHQRHSQSEKLRSHDISRGHSPTSVTPRRLIPPPKKGWQPFWTRRSNVDTFKEDFMWVCELGASPGAEEECRVWLEVQEEGSVWLPYPETQDEDILDTFTKYEFANSAHKNWKQNVFLCFGLQQKDGCKFQIRLDPKTGRKQIKIIHEYIYEPNEPDFTVKKHVRRYVNWQKLSHDNRWSLRQTWLCNPRY